MQSFNLRHLPAGPNLENNEYYQVLPISRSFVSHTSQTNDIPPLKGISPLDRFSRRLGVLAMAIGSLLGNLVPSTGPALRQGEFVGVSIPIDMFSATYTKAKPAGWAPRAGHSRYTIGHM